MRFTKNWSTKLLLSGLLLLPSGLLAQPTVSAISTASKSHSFVHLQWTTSSTPNKIRVRFGSTTAYEGSAGGGIEFFGDGGVLHTVNRAPVTGLAPSTLYHFCPQSSTDGGSTWSTCVDHTETTSALPAVHPALPEAPATFTTTYPNTAGYTTRNATCANLQTHINDAAADQANNGSVIVITAGSVCDTTSYELKSDGLVKNFPSTDVNTATDVITLNAHGYSEGQAVRLSSGNPINTNPAIWPPQNSGLIAGQTYYVRNPATNTFQLASTIAGTPIDFTSAGSGNHYIRAWPPTSYWIVITSSAAADLPPDGVRITPEWAAKMVVFKPAGRLYETNQAVFTQSMMSPGTNLAHHYYFRGIEFSTKDTATAEAATTTNPKGYYGHIETYHDASNIVINQCYFHRAAHPNRIAKFVYFGGENMAIVNSHMEEMTWWFAFKEGLNGSRASNTQMVISTGSFHTATATRTTTSTATLDITGGTTTGVGKVYFAMNGVLTYLIPSGMTGICAGGGISCTVTVSGVTNPDYPVNGESRIAGAPLGEISFTGGAITNFVNYDTTAAGALNDFWESSSNLLGLGPGPYKIENNYSSGTGIVWHFDDAMNMGDSWRPRGYTINRNRFVFPTYAITNHPDTNNLRYVSRHLMEWKNGTHIAVTGNRFENNPHDGTPVTAALAIMPQTGGKITDIKVADNVVSGGAGGFAVMGQAQSYSQTATLKFAPPIERTLIENNVFFKINSYLYKGNRSVADAASAGFTLDSRSGIEDYIVRNNTTYDMRGTNTFFIRTGPMPVEGMSLIDNLLTNGDYLMAVYAGSMVGSNPTFTGSNVGKNGMDQMWRQGVGTPSYTFSGNALVPWYSDNSVPSGITSAATHCTNFGGTYSLGVCSGSILSYLFVEASVAANTAALAFANAEGEDLTPLNASPLISGAGYSTQQTGIGADTVRLNRALGVTTILSVLDIRTTQVTVEFLAPDAGTSCYAFYGTSTDPATWSKTSANTTNDYFRSITITSLTTTTKYNMRVGCAGTYLTETKTFTTR